MISGIALLILTSLMALWLVGAVCDKFPVVNRKFATNMYFYHLLLTFAYYGYAAFNPSDSQYYYIKLINLIHGEGWFNYYATSTGFIEFLGYPFVQWFGFSYEAMMVVFSFFGFVGCLFLYIFFKENITFKHHAGGYDLVNIIFLLPNVHFWSSSFGKGSVIFMGIGLFFFALTKLKSRWIVAGIASVIIYHVRPHIMLVALISSAIGFLFTTKGISPAMRTTFLLAVTIGFIFIYKNVLTMVDISEEQLVSGSVDFSGRARELSKATSRVDINSYSLPVQLLTFLYRPLFIDAPGALGLIVSFENAFYVWLTFKIFSMSGLRYLFTSTFLVKTAFFTFFLVSLALAQVSGNLGLAMRQKSQVMILLLFVILSYLDSKKREMYLRRSRRIKLRQSSDSEILA
jgi:hypothetical protein